MENKRKYNRLAWSGMASLLFVTFLTRMLTQVVVVVVVVVVAVYCQQNIYYPNTRDRHELYYCKLCKLLVLLPHYDGVAILAVSVVKRPTVQTPQPG